MTAILDDRDALKARLAEIAADRASLSDALNGTPCAEIRWRQERETFTARVAELESEVARQVALILEWSEQGRKHIARLCEIDALTALLDKAVKALEIGNRLVDYFGNDHTSFYGDGTPATFCRDARAVLAEIEAYRANI